MDRRKSIRLLGAVGALAALAAAIPAFGDGALAIEDVEGERAGLSAGHATLEEARQAALAHCSEGCSIVETFDGDCYEWEFPVHEVTVQSFALSKYEVTFDDWDACVSDGGCNGYRPNDVDWGRGTRPVINVSWEDAQSFVAWLSDVTGYAYRLPTESEWEYAARAGTETKYSWGNSIGNNRANCVGCGSRWDFWQTAPVGSFGENAFGLHDMHGNVSEWVEDCSNDGYEGAPSDGSAWLGEDCEYRVLRGGGSATFPRNLRSADRGDSQTTGYRASRDGFPRCPNPRPVNP